MGMKIQVRRAKFIQVLFCVTILVTGNKGIHQIHMLGFTALSNRSQFYLIKWNLTYWEDLCKAGRLWKRTDWKPLTVLMGWRAKTQKVFQSWGSCWHKTQDIISYCCHVSLRSSPLHILPSLPLIFKIQCFWGENWPGYDTGRAQRSWPWRGQVCPLWHPRYKFTPRWSQWRKQ